MSEDKRTEEVENPPLENTETQMEGEEAISNDNSASEEKQEVDELTKLKNDYEELNNKYLRLYSDFDNFRKRTPKERIELFKTAGEDILTSIIPAIDNFERALKSMSETTEVEGIKKGIDLIYQNLYSTLSQKGLKAMESSIHKDFDLNLHEAISRVPAPDKKLVGKVIDEVEKGYFLHDKVIRYAKVVIGE